MYPHEAPSFATLLFFSTVVSAALLVLRLLFAYVFPLVLAFRSFRSKLGTYFRRSSGGATLNCCLAVCFMPPSLNGLTQLHSCFFAFLLSSPLAPFLSLSLSLFSWRMFAFCCRFPALLTVAWLLRTISSPQNEPRKASRFPSSLGV